MPKNMVTYPPLTRYISETASSHRFRKAYTYRPKVTTFWCIRSKVEINLKKCEFAPCWKGMNVPERYVHMYHLMHVHRMMCMDALQLMQCMIHVNCLKCALFDMLCKTDTHCTK